MKYTKDQRLDIGRKIYDGELTRFQAAETDNAAMESINGWIKSELFMDFHITGEKAVAEEVKEYIHFFNEERPAYSLNYLTPKQYKELHAAWSAQRSRSGGI